MKPTPPRTGPPRHIPTNVSDSSFCDICFLRDHLNTYVYIHLKTGLDIWFYPTYVAHDYAVGYIWYNNHWNEIKMNFDDIISFF
ncbi:MAG: hypothetical protein FWD82_02565 [Defluviitaleaceae bacterium]|nr:hypothetical protein [Defluviitaleaceae bacterium]